MLKKDTSKTHYINVRLNVPDNAPLVVYHATLAGNWLVMGLKTDSSPVDAQLSKMEGAVENIVSLAAVGNLGVKQLMKCEVTMAITAKAIPMEEPKWTTMMAKNVCQVVS
jgi:hypothetical protein